MIPKRNKGGSLEVLGGKATQKEKMRRSRSKMNGIQKVCQKSTAGFTDCQKVGKNLGALVPCGIRRKKNRNRISHR